MEFFCKGGGGRGGLDPIHNFEAHFVPQELMIFCVQNRVLWTLLGTFPKKFILNMAILGVFGETFPLFGD